VIEIDIETKNEFDDLKKDLVDYDNRFRFQGVILSEVMAELDKLIK
jgi:hypothetical protein